MLEWFLPLHVVRGCNRRPDSRGQQLAVPACVSSADQLTRHPDYQEGTAAPLRMTRGLLLRFGAGRQLLTQAAQQ